MFEKNVLKNSPSTLPPPKKNNNKRCVLLDLRSHFYNLIGTEQMQAVNIMMALAKIIYIFMIKVKVSIT